VFSYSTASNLEQPQVVSVDVDEFVMTHKPKVLEAHTFILVSHAYTFPFDYTQPDAGEGNFKPLPRVTTPSDQMVTTFLPTILACVRGRVRCVRGRAWACINTYVHACVSACHSSPLARHATLLLATSTRAAPSLVLDTRRPLEPPPLFLNALCSSLVLEKHSSSAGPQHTSLVPSG